MAKLSETHLSTHIKAASSHSYINIHDDKGLKKHCGISHEDKHILQSKVHKGSGIVNCSVRKKGFRFLNKTLSF